MFRGIFPLSAYPTVCLAGLLLFSACSGNPKVGYTGDTQQDISDAVAAGDLPKIEALLAQDPELLHLKDANGKTLLHLAVMSDQGKVVTLLLAKGLDPNVRDNLGLTPLGALEDSLIRAERARNAIREGGGQT